MEKKTSCTKKEELNDFALLRHHLDERTRYYIMADRGGMKNSSSDKSTNSKNNNKKKYYAVASGRKPGVYETWDECKKQVFSFPNAQHKVNTNTFPPSFPPFARANALLSDERISRI